MDYSNSALRKVRKLGQSLGILRPLVLLYRRIAKSRYEAGFDEALLGLMHPGNTVWDVGAHVGLYTAKFAEAVGSSGTVVAFEPSPKPFEALEKSFGQVSNVVLVNAALGESDMTSEFNLKEDDMSRQGGLFSTEAGTVVPVIVKRGDTFVADKPKLVPNVVKVDVEGFEYEVLCGLGTVLKNPELKSVAVEVHFSILNARGMPDAPAKVVELLKSESFTVTWVDPSHLIAVRK